MINKEEFIKENGRVDFRRLKYSLDDLFDETPVFDIPPLSFDLEENNEKKIK